MEVEKNATKDYNPSHDDDVEVNVIMNGFYFDDGECSYDEESHELYVDNQRQRATTYHQQVLFDEGNDSAHDVCILETIEDDIYLIRPLDEEIAKLTVALATHARGTYHLRNRIVGEDQGKVGSFLIKE